MTDDEKQKLIEGLAMRIWDFLNIENNVPITGFMAVKIDRVSQEIIEAIEVKHVETT